MKLLKVDSEEEVKQLLSKVGFWNDNSAWRYLGDSPANYSTAGNQQSHPVTALVDKIVNSVDAVLTNSCLEQGIDPKSEKAPDNMIKAVEQFFGVSGGLIENLSANERTKLADLIHLVATGSPDKDPCYTIIDSGEGQTPSNVPSTLLSLPGNSVTNKSRVKFVQGIFNMGGTGVLRFCGRDNLQLIISRRNPKLVSKKDVEDSLWSFTIIRRRNPNSQRESSVFEYLAPKGKVLTFKADFIPALAGRYPESYSKPLHFGTCIKLYEYKIPSFRANAILDLNYELSRHFQQMALPIRIEERRRIGVQGTEFKGHTFDTTLAGMSVRLKTDRSKLIESDFPQSGSITIEGIGKIDYTIYAFKPDPTIRKRFQAGSEIVLTVNGQKHGKISKALFERREVGLDLIANDLMVVLNCTNINPRAREDLFMASRDRLTDGEERNKLEKAIEEMLAENEILEALAEKRREQLAKNAMKENQPLKNIMIKLLKQTPSLASCFPIGQFVSKESDFEWKKKLGKFNGKINPTFFRLENNVTTIKASCPQNSSTTIIFETDAENEYFSRARNPGKFYLKDSSLEKSKSLTSGIFKLKINSPKNSKVGDIIPIEVKITNKRNKPWIFTGKIRITMPEKQRKRGKKGGKRKKDEHTRVKKGIEGSCDDSGTSPPSIIPVYENDENWINYGMTKQSGAELITGKNGFTVLVNCDNQSLKSTMVINRDIPPDFLVYMFKLALAIFAIGSYHSFEGIRENKQTDITTRQKIREATQGFALVILPIILNLSKEVRKIK